MSAIDPPEKKGQGCFFYGCITLLVFVFVMAVAAFFVLRYVVKVANGKLDEYTDTQPVVFPKTQMSAGEMQKLQERVEAFNNAVKAHSNTPPLVLSAQDINALMTSGGTNGQDLKDVAHVEIEGDQIKGELSLPLEKYFRFPFVHFQGRYLNGEGTFKVGVTNQMLSVYVKSLEVKGKPLPPNFMTQLQGKNMAEDFNANPTNAETMSHYESIEIRDGKMILKAKEP